MRLLIVEDDEALRKSLATNLRAQGFAIDEAGDAAEAEYFAAEYAIALAIVDLGLPDRSGVELIEKLRNDGRDFPVLILTARDHWADKVKGLNAGADDYVVKPFNLDELSARINALLRRSAGHAQALVTVGSVLLDMRAQQVSIGDRPVELTAYEYRILEMLMLRPGQVITKAELTDQLYDQDFERDSNVLEVLITRLRKKLDPDRSLNIIETLRGRGYRMSDPDSDNPV